MIRFKTTTIFTLGFVAWAAIATAVAVYGFDHYERAWGRGPSYQVILWIISVAAIAVAVGFSLGSKQLTTPLPWWKPILLSSAFTLVFGALTYLAGYISTLGVEQDVRLLILGLLSFASSFLAAKLLSWHAAAANDKQRGD